MARVIYQDKYLSPEDKKKYLRKYAGAYVAYSGNDNLTFDDAVWYIEDLEKFKAELRKKHAIPADVDVEFSPIDGAILEA